MRESGSRRRQNACIILHFVTKECIVSCMILEFANVFFSMLLWTRGTQNDFLSWPHGKEDDGNGKPFRRLACRTVACEYRVTSMRARTSNRDTVQQQQQRCCVGKYIYKYMNREMKHRCVVDQCIANQDRNKSQSSSLLRRQRTTISRKSTQQRTSPFDSPLTIL